MRDKLTEELTRWAIKLAEVRRICSGLGSKEENTNWGIHIDLVKIRPTEGYTKWVNEGCTEWAMNQVGVD